MLLIFSIPGQLLAQHRDTLYVVEEEMVYDTLFVHDTLRTYDTVSLDEYIHSREFEQLFYSSGYVDSQQYPDSAKKLYRQTVTYWEKHVLHNEQEKIANMDSIKKYGLAALIVLGLNGLVPGQTDSISYHSKYPKHELGISYGVFPIIGFVNFGEYREFRKFNDLCPFYENQPILSGSVNLQYHHYFNKYNALDIDVSWAMYKHHNMIAVENQYKYGNEYLHFISAQIGYSIHFLHKEKVTLYSSVYLGGTIYYIGTLWDHYDIQTGEFIMAVSPVMTLKPALQINFIGIRVGKHNAANFELGFGTQGVLKCGYSYRF